LISYEGFGKSNPTSFLPRKSLPNKNLLLFDLLKNPVAEGSHLSLSKPLLFF